MKLIRILLLLLAVLLGVGWLVARQQRAPVRVDPVAATSPVRALLLAQPFELERPATHYWRAEMPQYTRGWILVLECDPLLLPRKQTVEPALACDGELLDRLNEGAKHGRVVAILPRPGASMEAALESLCFVSPERPEAVDAGILSRLWEQASDPHRVDADEWTLARARGGEAIRFEDRTQLEEHCAQLILEHAPEDRELAEGWLVPR
jgi:hypothetical protein